jgi:hypothetical protein
MADRSLKLSNLRKILRRFGVSEDQSMGKGSHTTFLKKFPEGVFSYPVPTHGDVLVCYVKGCRKKFRLRAVDGVTDEEFYDG